MLLSAHVAHRIHEVEYLVGRSAVLLVQDFVGWLRSVVHIFHG